jgi:hypothetical protein
MKLFVLLCALSSVVQAENLTGQVHLFYANSLYNGATAGQAVANCLDQSNPANYTYQVQVSVDDPTYSNGNQTTIAGNVGGKAGAFAAGTVGTVDMNDGNQHTVYFQCLSQASGPNYSLQGSPLPYKYVDGNVAQAYTVNLGSPAGRLAAGQLAILVNANDPYGIGSSGSMVCSASSVAYGSTAILSDGVVGFYVQQHGVPCSNVYVVALGTPAQTISQAKFTSTVGPAIEAMATTRCNGGANNCEAAAIGWVEPSAVVPAGVSYMEMSMTGAVSVNAIYTDSIIYNNTGGSIKGGGSFAQTNPYFNTTTATPYTSYGIRPAMMLAAETCPSGCTNANATGWQPSVSQMNKVVAAAVAGADHPPAGKLNCSASITTDTGYGELAAFISPNSYGSGMSSACNTQILGTAASPVSPGITESNNLYYIQGAAQWSNSTGTFAAGSIFIDFSSYGGQFPQGSQALAVWGLTQGAVAVAGMAYEPGPVDLPRKYPEMDIVIPNYTQGQTVIEALWKGTLVPWQVNFAGDPLASPYPLQPQTHMERPARFRPRP